MAFWVQQHSRDRGMQQHLYGRRPLLADTIKIQNPFARVRPFEQLEQRPICTSVLLQDTNCNSAPSSHGVKSR